MKEIAQVIELKDNQATVKVIPSSHCGNCNLCSAFGNEDFKTLTVNNSINAKVNDRVIIEIKETKKIQFSFLIYVFPLVMMILGYFLGDYVWTDKINGDNIAAIVLAIVFLLLSFVFVYFIDKKMAKKSSFSPSLTEFYTNAITKSNQSDCCH